ncbi:hypothetical protein RB601_007537 [Gaeumannomyces tritici]
MPRTRYIITYTLCGCVREMERESSENQWVQETIDAYCGYPDCPRGSQSHYSSSYHDSYGSYGGGSSSSGSRRSRRY